jgi:O-antigen/teichoic acid export membrane protein
LGWFVFFDVGLTQGLRNRFAEARAKGDEELARNYVSTTYAILGIIFTGVWLVFMIANEFIDWSQILKVSETMRAGSDLTCHNCVYIFLCMTFVSG